MHTTFVQVNGLHIPIDTIYGTNDFVTILHQLVVSFDQEFKSIGRLAREYRKEVPLKLPHTNVLLPYGVNGK